MPDRAQREKHYVVYALPRPWKGAALAGGSTAWLAATIVGGSSGFLVAAYVNIFLPPVDQIIFLRALDRPRFPRPCRAFG